MCRLLGIAAEAVTNFSTCLCDAPRSMATQSREQRDGWGAAVYAQDGAWLVAKHPVCAADDAAFASAAMATAGVILVAHVRAQTVGAVSAANTHPFQRDGWVFAHNGTVNDLHLRSRTSLQRQREVEGETDSELLFAYLLTKLDECGLTRSSASFAIDETLARAVGELTRRHAGTMNFVLSNGSLLYAHRCGRPLYLLERPACGGSPAAFLVASEPVTKEAWLPLDELSLVRCSRPRALAVRFIRGADPRGIGSGAELPFTD
jgi:predicted glutamine amidotransferase